MTDIQAESRQPWLRPEWSRVATAWIREQLARHDYTIKGSIEEVQTNVWAHVLRVPTREGDCYFKAIAASLGHEVPLTATLAQLAPEFLPEVLAVDTERLWLLMKDGGRTLRSYTKVDGDATRWEEMVRQLAGLQMRVVEHTGQLLAAGAYDRRLSILPRLYTEALEDTDLLLIGKGGLREGELEQFRAFEPQVKSMCDALAAYAIPESLHHDDLGANNILVNGERYLFFDWSDSGVTHPFFTMMIVLRYAEFVLKFDAETLERIKDAYLSCWTVYEPVERSREALELALRLAKLCRALSWRQIVRHLQEGELKELEDHADAFPYWLQVFLGTEE